MVWSFLIMVLLCLTIVSSHASSLQGLNHESVSQIPQFNETTKLNKRPLPGRWPISTVLALEIVSVNRKLKSTEASDTIGHGLRIISELLDYYRRDEVVPHGLWTYTENNIHLDVGQNARLRPHYPELTYGTLQKVVQGLWRYYMTAARGEYFEVTADIYADLNGRGWVDIGYMAFYRPVHARQRRMPNPEAQVLKP